MYMSCIFLHGKMDVKIFLMFIVAENIGSVNIFVYFHCSKGYQIIEHLNFDIIFMKETYDNMFILINCTMQVS